MGRCTICQCEPCEELRHLPLYISGSEGIDICYACSIALTEILRGMKSACSRSRIEVAKERHKLEKEFGAQREGLLRLPLRFFLGEGGENEG